MIPYNIQTDFCSYSPDTIYTTCGVVPFHRACNKHDHCFGRLDLSRDECDATFLQDLATECKEACTSPLGSIFKVGLDTCLAGASTYATAARRFGLNAHNRAQRNAKMARRDDGPFYDIAFTDSQPCKAPLAKLGSDEFETYNNYGDLNRGTKGDPIYICLSKTPNGQPPIQSISFVLDSQTCAEGWEVDSTDLNATAGGKAIHTCVKRGEDAPIRFVQVTHWHASENICGPLQRVETDLNAGAGGDYIYLCVGH